MHYYTALTSLSMTENLAHRHIWQLIIPPLAFSHSYLLHGILSLSALHRYYDAKPEERRALINMAREHQQAALSVYIGHLQNINENNCHAMFAYSIILGGICYSFIRERQGGPEQDDIVEMIVAAFDTLIGATAVAVHAREWLHSGQLKPLMTPLISYDECLTRLAPASRNVIDFLLHSLPAVGTVMQGVEEPMTEESHAIYTTAIRALVVGFPHADGGLSSVSEVVSWPIMAGTGYLMLLKQQDPLALLILAYYGVALHYCNRSWFLQGSGKRLVLAIAEKVANPWLVHIVWAKRQVLAEAGTDPALLTHDVEMLP